jgi:hypothetical protein
MLDGFRKDLVRMKEAGPTSFIEGGHAEVLCRVALVALTVLALVPPIKAQVVVRLPDAALRVRDVKEVPAGSGQVWVISKTGAYRVQGTKSER